MDRREYEVWSKQFDGIDHALCDLAEGITFDELVERVYSIDVKLIDFQLLTTIPITMYSGYVSPRIYAVLSNGGFCEILGEQTYASGIQLIGEIRRYVSWQEALISCPDRLGPLGVPVALYFHEKKRYDVNHLVFLIRSGGSKVDNLKLAIHQSQPEFNLKDAVSEIEASFRNGGWQGVEDLEARLETGIGCGGASSYASSIINNINAIQ